MEINFFRKNNPFAKSRNDIFKIKSDKESYSVYNDGKEKYGYTNEYYRNNSIIILENDNSAGYVNYIMEKFYSIRLEVMYVSKMIAS